MQSVVSGRASRRFTEISSPHSSQMPNVPSSILRSPFSIFSRKLFSRPRRRNVNDWRYSLEARSISSGRSSVSSVMSCSSVCLAFLRISSRFSVSSVLNFLRVALFTVDLWTRFRTPDQGAGNIKHQDPSRQRLPAAGGRGGRPAPFLSCLVLSCLVLSCLVLSCLVLRAPERAPPLPPCRAGLDRRHAPGRASDAVRDPE